MYILFLYYREAVDHQPQAKRSLGTCVIVREYWMSTPTYTPAAIGIITRARSTRLVVGNSSLTIWRVRKYSGVFRNTHDTLGRTRSKRPAVFSIPSSKMHKSHGHQIPR